MELSIKSQNKTDKKEPKMSKRSLKYVVVGTAELPVQTRKFTYLLSLKCGIYS